MRSVAAFDEDLREEADTEITLGIPSLLGIFFAVVLVCGVFFGFGYSLGRRTTAVPASSAALSPKTSPAPQPTASTKPSPQQALSSVVTQQPEENPIKTLPASRHAEIAPPAAHPAKAPAVVPAETAPKAAAAYSGTLMVQIAAVSRPQDANALASALRKAGFDATVRSQSQDKLLHVQVGPFASRDEAKAMRQKLVDAGYNAFIR